MVNKEKIIMKAKMVKKVWNSLIRILADLRGLAEWDRIIRQLLE